MSNEFSPLMDEKLNNNYQSKEHFMKEYKSTEHSANELIMNYMKDYLPDEYSSIECSISQVRNENGCVQVGYIFTRPNSNISVRIYLEKYLQRLRSRENESEIMREIALCYLEHIAELNKLYVCEFTDLEKVKEKIFPVMVNYSLHSHLFNSITHRTVSDMAIIYEVEIPNLAGGATGVFRVNNNTLKKWGLTEEQLHKLAMKNLKEIKKPGIQFYEEIHGFTICSKDGEKGAAFITDRRIHKGIQEMLPYGCYIIPASIDEVTVVPKFYSISDVYELSKIIYRSVPYETSKLAEGIYELNYDDGSIHKILLEENS